MAESDGAGSVENDTDENDKLKRTWMQTYVPSLHYVAFDGLQDRRVGQETGTMLTSRR